MANCSTQHPTTEPSAGHPKTYRVNTGSVAFRPFTANSVEQAIEHVRRHQNPNYAAARWLQVRENGVYVWVT